MYHSLILFQLNIMPAAQHEATVAFPSLGKPISEVHKYELSWQVKALVNTSPLYFLPKFVYFQYLLATHPPNETTILFVLKKFSHTDLRYLKVYCVYLNQKSL